MVGTLLAYASTAAEANRSSGKELQAAKEDGSFNPWRRLHEPTMNGLPEVRHSRLTTIRQAAQLLLACVAIGTLTGCGFGLLCGGLHDLLHWNFGKTIRWGMGFALAGAATGVILGLYALTDRVLNARYWESRSTQMSEPTQANAMPTTEHESRVGELDGHAERPSKTSPARDSASTERYLW